MTIAPTVGKTGRPVRGSLFFALLTLIVSGCSAQLNTEYADARGDSVNGIRVFADYLRSQGHPVAHSRRFTPRIADSAEIIVYFDRGTGVSNEVRDWMERWLRENYGVELVIVLRDSNPAVDYWERVLAEHKDQYTPEQIQRIQGKLQEAKIVEAAVSANTIVRGEDGWFGQKAAQTPRVLESLQPGEFWEDDFKAADGFRIRNLRETQLHEEFEPAVMADDQVLIASRAIGNSRVWIVTNSSFLLNFSLVDHQNRRLAAEFAEVLGYSYESKIAFVSEAAVGDDGDAATPTLWRFLTVTPINWIAAHVMLALLTYMLYRAAIFGRPKHISRRESYQFKQHVDALAKLLRSTGDVAFAQQRLDSYRKRKSSSHEEASGSQES